MGLVVVIVLVVLLVLLVLLVLVVLLLLMVLVVLVVLVVLLVLVALVVLLALLVLLVLVVPLVLVVLLVFVVLLGAVVSHSSPLALLVPRYHPFRIRALIGKSTLQVFSTYGEKGNLFTVIIASSGSDKTTACHFGCIDPIVCIYLWTHSHKTCFQLTSNIWVSGVKLWSFPA